VEAVDFGEAAEVVGGGRVLGVDSANAFEGAWVALEHTGDVAVVPTIVDDLDEHSSQDLVGLHEFEKLVDGRVFCGRIGAGGEGKGGIVLPDVNVGVDEWSGCCGGLKWSDRCGG
jgi:hypothetical protein